MHRIYKSFFILLLISVAVSAQDSKPLTNQEFVKLLYQLQRSPDTRDELIEQIRQRGIGFPLTDGMRSLVATKSGNDSQLRRTLEEAERRRVNPTASTLPPENEGQELLQRTRNVTLMAANAMPDFLVKQIIKRSVAYGNTTNWIPQDNLTIAVGYRANVGEEYKVLTVNGMAPSATASRKRWMHGSPGGSLSRRGHSTISAFNSRRRDNTAGSACGGTNTRNGQSAALASTPAANAALPHEAMANGGRLAMPLHVANRND